MPSRFERTSGLLLHPTSLPGGHGVGDLGAEAFRFIDFLESAGHHLWQVLPLTPPGPANSPYASPSAFAGSPLLVSLDLLREEGFLEAAEIEQLPRFADGAVDYPGAAAAKVPLLRRAATRFAAGASGQARDELAQFRTAAPWLEDWALFRALEEAYGGQPWQRWEEGYRRREQSALDGARRDLREDVEFHTLTQFWFWKQWQSLRASARHRNIQIVGDIPIFVAENGADVWSCPQLFSLDENGYPTVVAGVPPDYFSATGQRWGNPLYRWEVMAEEGYRWWVDRLRTTLDLVDVVRIDHFRGLAAYWEIPAENRTAEHGRWVPGPGAGLFGALRDVLGDIPIIVEDLGVITPDVVELREALGYPGMKVLQFAFDSGPSNPFLPHNFDRNVVVYTGTHDNDTSRGWFESCSAREQEQVRRYLNAVGQDIAWDLIRLALSSVADVAIYPVQDVLGLGSEGRMNYPGRVAGNWTWRLRPGQLSDAHGARLADLATLFGRNASPTP